MPYEMRMTEEEIKKKKIWIKKHKGVRVGDMIWFRNIVLPPVRIVEQNN